MNFESEQVKQMRDKLTQMYPSQREKILSMNQQDLKDRLSRADNGPSKSKSSERLKKQAKILSVCPGMEQELRQLDDGDLEQIYQNYLSPLHQMPLQSKIEQSKAKLDGKSINGVSSIVDKKELMPIDDKNLSELKTLKKKLKKLKHKCKITFYLNESDFEEGKTNQGDQKNRMLSKIVENLSRVFENKLWKNQQSASKQKSEQKNKKETSKIGAKI